MRKILFGLALLFAINHNVHAVETAVFSDPPMGFFRILLTPDELKGISPADLTVEAKTPEISLVVWVASRGKQTSAPAQQKACFANIRLLESARDMYNMDSKEPLPRFDEKGYQTLLAKGFLNAPLSLPEPGCKYHSSESYGRIVCKIHGTAPNPWEEERRRHEEQRSSLEIKPGLMILGRFRPVSEGQVNLFNQRSGKLFRELSISLSPDKPSLTEVKDQWLEAWTEETLLRGARTPGNPTFSFLARQMPSRVLKGGSLHTTESGGRNGEPRAEADLYSLTTGALAIQESLQLDRMTNVTGSREPAVLDIAVLDGPKIKSHPFREMIGSRKPVVLPIDELVPDKFYACHFTSINKQMDFGDLLDQWGTSMLHTIQVAAHDAQIKEKFQDQLCLKPSELTRLFGDQVIDDMTICGADPFLNEGTDLSVIFTIKNMVLFDLNAQKNFAEARSRFPACVSETVNIEGVSVSSLATPDDKVRSFSCTLDSFKVYSNSPEALKTIILTWKKKSDSLAQSLDYQYMRTIFPHDAKTEDLFLYLSDPHIRRLVSPAWKIARQRRIQCLTSLRMIHDAVTLFHLEATEGPPTMERLKKDGFLHDSHLLCPDNGSYSFSGKPDSEPACSVHGRMRLLRPIIELQPLKISAREKKDYTRFLEEYNRYWSQFFDPVGVRGKITPAGVQLETCILPLVDNTIYDGFRLLSGGDPVLIDVPLHPRTIVQFMGKLDPGEVTRLTPQWDRTLRDLLIGTSFTLEEFLKGIGRAFHIGLIDGDMRFDFDHSLIGRRMPGAPSNPLEVLIGGFFLSALNLPAYAMVEVKEEETVSRFIREWLSYKTSENVRSNNRQMRSFVEFRSYESRIDPTRPAIHTLDLVLFILHYRFFFAVHQGQLIISTQRELLNELLDPALQRFKTKTNLELRIRYEAFDQVSRTTKLGWQEQIRQACQNNLGVIYQLSRYRRIKPEDWNAHSLRINGFVPFCPEGGIYRDLPEQNSVSCTIHGDHLMSRQPWKADPKQPLNRFLDSLKEIGASLDFTPEGIMTRVFISR